MKDLLPTFTFGFLMAQLFPGATTLLCLTSPYLAYTYAVGTHTAVQNNVPSLMSMFARVGDLWFGSTRNAIVFLFLAAATGMFLHGLDWMILGWEMQKRDENGKPLCDAKGNPEFLGLREMAFHKQPIWWQILLGPLNMLKEIFRLLKAPELKWITVEENASNINPTSIPIFTWLQDFYLYFAQFYIHMAYSLLAATISFALVFVMIGITPLRTLFLISLYLLAGLFFLMGRTQLSSLFKNEATLVELAQKNASPTEIVVALKD